MFICTCGIFFPLHTPLKRPVSLISVQCQYSSSNSYYSPPYSLPNEQSIPWEAAGQREACRCSSLSVLTSISKLANRSHSPAFSATTRSKLSPLPSGPASLNLQTQLHEQINGFPGSLASLTVSNRQDLDTEGLTLWNLATRLMRANDCPTSPEQRATLLAARVFAFLLLDGGLGKGNNSPVCVSLADDWFCGCHRQALHHRQGLQACR
jgi:hypothetical protein